MNMKLLDCLESPPSSLSVKTTFEIRLLILWHFCVAFKIFLPTSFGLEDAVYNTEYDCVYVCGIDSIFHF